ncbi:MAG: YkgJ family cysteine cluster protein [Thermoanaerobaculales bacterium]|nr:YkgJ family cysteine cluster protein [Thermoanaerobaculales bacterium]
MNRENPCFAHDCHMCCLNTRMTLTEADAARLETAGNRDFYFVNDDHDLQLVNVDGHCIFLVDGRCSVHDDRPEGCRLYPLILDLSVDRVVLDAFCPWAREFAFTQDDRVQLRKSVTDEEGEARKRASGRSRRAPPEPA